ncbi:MAG: cyclase family protein [Actinomycetota bacterium]
MPDALLEAIGHGVRVFDLGREMIAGMPQSLNHPEFRMALLRRHGDVMRADGGSAANELIVTGGHVGTHIDALSHVSQDMQLHAGVDARTASEGGRFSIYGIETVEPFLCRGIVLDIESEAAYEITPEDLDAACARQGVRPEPGDVVLIRTGWGRLWPDRDRYGGRDSGVPGPGEAGARWLASKGIRAAGGDTIAFEHLAPRAGHTLLPGHRVLLVEHGIHIIETLALEEIAAAGVHEFLFVLSPLKIVGATGSPVRPLAVVPA